MSELENPEYFAPSEREIIEAMSPAGGWSQQQLAQWGIGWPPPQGWRANLVAKGDEERRAYAIATGWREGGDGRWRRSGLRCNPMTLEGACALEAIIRRIDEE